MTSTMDSTVTSNGTAIADDRFRSEARFTTLRALREHAEHQLSEAVWNYLWTGTGDETTADRNVAKFDEVLWEVPLFAGVSNPTTNTNVFGIELALPLFTAPFGQETEFHSGGHLAVGRAAQEAGIAQMVPVAAAYSMEEIAGASDRALFFQMTLVGKLEHTLAMAQRAKDAGYQYLIATYSPIRQWRERLIHDKFSPRNSSVHNVNFGPGKSDPAPLQELINFTEPRWTWAEAAEFIRRSPLPVVVKGISSARDATAALDAGAVGLYVSNYGGRTIDRTLSAIETLPEVRKAAGPDVPIVLDSGIRRGSDIAAALALGANAVAIGRLTAVGLAADGEAGVLRTIELLRDELWTTLGHLGCSSVADLGPDAIRQAPNVPTAG
ncbi:alpha-hydroxy acid oxidase [Kribbella hippodromi]|uniref:Alpha-hydroxy acid oxidase n=1 Tax=Kribbella hippodromi TaxID=434347 RepID=A0ABP4PVZ6_9ACTN